MKKCIYCHTNLADSKEHHLPEALGNFVGYKKLLGKICKQCNSDIGKTEGALLKTSDIGAMRCFFSIQGKKRKKDENPFYKSSYKMPPIGILGMDPFDGKERSWELKDKGIAQLEALYVVLKSEERFTIPLPPAMQSSEGILKEFAKNGINKADIEMIEISVAPENCVKIENALKTVIPNPKKTEWSEYKDTSSQKVSIQIKFVRTMEYYQAIAKIGFHYLLTYCDYFTGNEKEFDSIKQYIKEGCNDPEEIKKFVVEEKDHLLYKMQDGFVPEDVGHLLIMDINPNRIKISIQLFVGSQLYGLPWVYPFTINIGQNPQRILCNFSTGHYFFYYKDGKINGFDGEMTDVSSLYK